MRPAMHVCLTLAAAALLAGCGGKKSAAPSTAPTVPPVATTTPTTAPTVTLPPTVTSAADLAACLELMQNLRIVSALMSQSTEQITQALHPKDLAVKTRNSQKSMLYAAKVLALVDAPPSLTQAQAQLVGGMRRFAADFGRAARATEKGDILKASQELHDGVALTALRASTAKITRACGNG